ncbi:pentapeptide repeat-containing protein [Nonomuraea rhizosphaerae]|uniref:pentapeptide repeat-containing protein n=1 Tax=Nonomuraea rhizosphaerae TaxID=2665663 RepID=UPI001C5F428F|nr:pentapeptide repeat-containing protein [Nonomuraea rhizosphaerae]
MDWVTCAHSAACKGIARQPYGYCLAHLQPEELAETLGAMIPGRLLDLRGTLIDGDLLGRVVEATNGRPGRTRLERATFTGDVRLSGVTFTGDVSLDGARFERLASFFGARFEGNVSLAGASFARELSFHGVRVRGHLSLDRAVMARDALFSQAVFGHGLSCERARFDGYATFDDASLGDGASFRGARFGRTLSFRKVTGGAGFDAAHFAADAYLSATGRFSASRARADGTLDVVVGDCQVNLRRMEVAGGTTIRLTDSQADLEGAVLRGPSTVTGRGRSTLTSLRHVDAADLALFGLDLSGCRFAGLTRPAAVRVRNCTFALTPRGVRVSLRWPMLRWFSRRSALADEHTMRGWDPPPDGQFAGQFAGPSGPDGFSAPDGLAALYAGLRDHVDDHGTSADFAFAAMEMQRQATHRWWLSVSWLLWGYGMRLGRAAAWFGLLVALTVGALFWTSTSHADPRADPPAVHR